MEVQCFFYLLFVYVQVDDSKKLGEWAGLCKIDKEGKARKVNGCGVVVVKVCDFDYYQWGWDSSTFTQISVEQKLKSVVDGDHFREEEKSTTNIFF